MSRQRRRDHGPQEAAAIAGGLSGEEYVSGVSDAIERAQALFEAMAAQKGSLDVQYLKGFAAEVHHAASFDVDAARRGLDGLHAEVPDLTSKASPDIRVIQDGQHVADFQSKYYRSAEDTAKAISKAEYADGGKIVPSDQLAGVREHALREAHRNTVTRPDVAGDYQDTAGQATDRVAVGGAESRPLTEPEAKALAREAQRGELDVRRHGYGESDVIQASDVAREAGEAALTAAGITAALRAAPHVYQAVVTLVRERNLDSEQLRAAGTAALQGAGEGGARGAVAGTLTVLCRSGALGEGLSGLSAGAIGAMTAVALGVAGDTVRLGRGELSAGDFADRTARRVSAGGAAYAGAAVGQAVIPVPLLGAAVGAFIGGQFGSAAYDGTKNASRWLANEEGWRTQVKLAEAIVQLAQTTEIVVERTRVVARHAVEEERALAAAADDWRVMATTQRALLESAGDKTRATRSRLEGMQQRLKALESPTARLPG